MKTGTLYEKNAFVFDPCSATASLFLFAKRACIVCVHHDTLAIKQIFSNHTENIQLLAVDMISEQGAGKWVASYDAGRTVIIWNCLTGNELIRYKSDQNLTTVTWMQNGNVAFGNTQGTVILFKPAKAKFVSITTIDQTPITALAPASDCKTFAIGYIDGTLVIATLEPKFMIKYNISISGLSSQISTLVWHSSSSRQKSDMLASQYQNGDLRVWSIAKSDFPYGNEAKVIRVLRRSDNNLAGYNWLGWSKNGRIVQFSERKTWLWDVRTKKVTHELVPTLEDVRGLAVYGAGATLFTLGENNTVQQFDLHSPSQLVKKVQFPTNILQFSHPPVSQDLQNNTVQSDSIDITPECFEIQSNQLSQIIPARPDSSQSQKSITSQDSMSQHSRKFNIGSDTSFESKSETNMIHNDSPWFSSQEPSLGSGRDSPSLRSNNSQSETSETLPFMKYHLGSRKILDNNFHLNVYELFPFTKDRLNRNLGNLNSNTLGMSYFSNQNWCRRMFRILFDWNGESQGLINDEMRRHSPQSITRILLGRWLGEVDLDNIISCSGSMTQSDWMLLALNGIGKQISMTRLAQVYAQRLLDCGDFHTAATIMISMGDPNDAIQVYSHYEKYLEAIILTCLVFPTDKSRHIQLVQKWGEWAVNCNQDQLAAICHALIDSKSSGSWCSSILLNARFGQGRSNNHVVPEILSPPLSPPDTRRPLRNIALASALKLNTSFQNQYGGQCYRSKLDENIVTPICSALSPVAGETAQTAFFQPGLNSVYQTPVSALTATPKSYKKQNFSLINGTATEELCSYEKKQTPQNESTPSAKHNQEKYEMAGSQSNTLTQVKLYTDSPSIDRATTTSPMVQKKNDDVIISLRPFVSPLRSSFFASRYETQSTNSSIQQNRSVDLEIQWPPLDSIITGDYMASPNSSRASHRYQTSNIFQSPTIVSDVWDSMDTKIYHGNYNINKEINRNLDDYISSLESAQNENIAQSSIRKKEKNKIYEPPKDQSLPESRGLELPSSASQLPPKDHHYDDSVNYNDDSQNNTLVSTEILSHIKNRKLSRRVASCDNFPLFNPDNSLTSTEIERGRSQDREGSKMRVPSTPTWPTRNIFHGEDEGDDDLRQYRENLKSFDSCDHGFTQLYGFGSQGPRNSSEGSPNHKNGKPSEFSPHQRLPRDRPNKSPIRYFQRELHHHRSVSDVRLCDQKIVRNEVILKRKKAARELEERRKSLVQRPSAPTIIHPEELDRLSPLPQLKGISKVSPEIDSPELQRSHSNQARVSTTTTKAQPNYNENKKEMTMKKSLGLQFGLPATPKALKNLISDTHGKSLSHIQPRNVGRYETPTKPLSRGKPKFFSHQLEKFQKLAPLPKTTFKASKTSVTTPTRRMPPRSASAPILQEPPTSPLALPSDLPTHPAFQVAIPPSSYKRFTDEKKNNNTAPLWYIRKVSPGKSKPGTLGYQTQHNQTLQNHGIAGFMDGIDEVIESTPPSPPAPPLLKELQHLAGPHPPPPPPPPPLPPPPPYNLERPNTNSVVSAISSGSGIIEIIRDDFYDDPFLHTKEMKDNSDFFTSITSPVSTKNNNFSKTCDYRLDINHVHSYHQSENSFNISSIFTEGHNQAVNVSPNDTSHASNPKITWVPSSSPLPRRSATASPPSYLAGNRSRFFLPDHQNYRHNGHRRCHTNDTRFPLLPDAIDMKDGTEEGGIILKKR